MSTDLVQTKANSLKRLMDAAKREIEAALPKHVTPERMMRIALTEARKNPKLLDCDQASFLGAVIQASQLGLEPGGSLGHCWLIPYNNKKKNIQEVQFQIGYRGMLDLAMRNEKVSHISCRAVYENDHFEFEYGLNEGLVHKPSGNPGKLTHVYCVVFLKNGCKMFDVMSVDEVESVRRKSKSPDTGPWVEFFDEMAKKSVIRRLFKYMPISVELSKAANLDELSEIGESQGNSSVIEVQGRDVTPKENGSLAEKLKAQQSEQTDSDPNSFNNFHA